MTFVWNEFKLTSTLIPFISGGRALIYNKVIVYI